jgi:competence ComEA-like helix-hairpin-helix protein
MARISLRAYNREIEAMIDRNETDEAIIHCRTILKRYPKHVDTYRLMGKALLEAQRFGDASDVFHRVLSSVPDDFIAHLGMSIIREDEGNMDGAIWHMERSFEVQPSNAAIQVELRRLYGVRDGLTPQKIQLTRGALARMSAKSNLYSQAIAELRTALSDDPQRPDLQVLLASMYAQTGARMEAIETCNALLSKLPYCFEANRILAEILPETERSEQAQEFKDRLIEIDPYYAHLSPVAITVDQVSDGAITIEQYDNLPEGDQTESIEQPEWAASLGISLEDETLPEDDSPDWLSPEEDSPEIVAKEQLEISEEEVILEDVPEIPSPEPIEQEDLPDWMSNVGWEQVSDESEASVDGTPEWLRSVMEEPGEDKIPGKGTVDTLMATSEIESEETEDSEAPSDVEAAVIDGAAAVAGAALGAMLSDADEEVEKDSETGQEKEPEESLMEIDAEGDLSAEDDLEIQPSEFAETAEKSTPEGPGTEAGDISGAALIGAAALEEIADDQDNLLGDEQAITSAEELETASDVTGELEDIPDWLQDLGEGIPDEVPPVDESTLEDQETQPELEEQIPLDTGLEDGIDLAVDEEFPENIPEWLSEVSPEIAPDAELAEDAEPSDDLDIVQAKLPEWLQQMEQEHLAQMAEESEEIEDLKVLEFDSEISDLTSEDVPSWLIAAIEPEKSDEHVEVETVESIEEIFHEPHAEDVVVPKPDDEAFVSESDIDEEILELPPEAEGQIIEEELIDSDTQPVVISEPAEFKPDIELDALAPEMVDEGDLQIEGDEVLEPTPELEDQLTSPEVLAEPPPLTTDAALSDEDEDAAMAWLENLAERQGAAEEELITSPEERLEEPPEWIQEAVTEDESPEDDTEGVPGGIAAAAIAGVAIGKHLGEEEEQETLPVESDKPTREAEVPEWIPDLEEPQVEAIETPSTEPPAPLEVEAVSEEAPEDESIEAEEIAAAAVAGAAIGERLIEEDEPEVSEAELPGEPEEIITGVEEPELETPEPAPSEPQLILEGDEVEDEMVEELISTTERVPEDEPEVPEAELPGEPEELFTGIEEPEPETPEPALSEPQLVLEGDEVEDEKIEEPISTTEEVPQSEQEVQDWYRDIEGEEVSGETPPVEWSPTMLVEEEAPSEDTQEILVDAKLDLNAASLAQLERIHSIGFIHAQRIINYRETSGPFKDYEELGKVPGLTPEIVEDLKEYLTVEVVAEAPPPLSTHPDLQNAWNSISAGEIDEAVDQYTQMINKDENLDEVIRDLQEGIAKFPMDASLYQTLGDAYLHANLLQEALDAYNRAEDLIS